MQTSGLIQPRARRARLGWIGRSMVRDASLSRAGGGVNALALGCRRFASPVASARDLPALPRAFSAWPQALIARAYGLRLGTAR